MKVTISVKTNARRDEVTPQEDGSLLVRVNVPPVEGRANERIILLLAEHFDVPKSRIRIISGAHSKKKVVEVQ